MTTTATYPVVTAEHFPHGLLCHMCERTLPVGSPFAEQLVGVTHDVASVIDCCVYCALAEPTCAECDHPRQDHENDGLCNAVLDRPASILTVRGASCGCIEFTKGA